jgi:hypothetical protein
MADKVPGGLTMTEEFPSIRCPACEADTCFICHMLNRLRDARFARTQRRCPSCPPLSHTLLALAPAAVIILAVFFMLWRF